MEEQKIKEIIEEIPQYKVNKIANENAKRITNVFKELNNFKKALQRKAEDISTNPMNYVNNKIVAYKNPHHPVTDPYNLSAYSGMMFNDYC